MKKIASFTINHDTLERGLYVSRKDENGDCLVTTFDLRFTLPNREPPMDTAACHTIEHLGATFLRASEIASDVVYFGPMGCRTGFYLLLFGDKKPSDIFKAVVETCDFILNFDGEIPGAKRNECGNYLDHNLSTAKFYTKIYRDDLIQNKRFEY